MNVNENASSNINRREFLVLAATAAVAAAGSTAAAAVTPAERLVDAGPASHYAKDGIYTNFRDHGFFLIRSNGKLVAYSSICTHRACKITAKPDHSFYCPCHGSTFAPDGKVTHGPAKRNLPSYTISTNKAGHLIVKVSASV